MIEKLPRIETTVTEDDFTIQRDPNDYLDPIQVKINEIAYDVNLIHRFLNMILRDVIQNNQDIGERLIELAKMHEMSTGVHLPGEGVEEIND